MSVQSIGQTSGTDWLSQLLAAYAQQNATSQTSLESLLPASADQTSADSSSETSSASSGSSIGSFNDILAALLAGSGSLSYDMETGSLVAADAGGGQDMAGSQGLTREVSETENEDGSTTTSVTLTDADGNVVGTEKTISNADGSFTTTITMTGPDGKSSTRSITGENTDDGFLVTNTLADAEGNILETGTELTASDGAFTHTLTLTGPDGQTVTDSETFDADGKLVATSTSSTSSTTTPAAADSASSSTSGSSGSSETASSDGASGSSGSSSDDDDSSTTTTVTMSFTDDAIVQTITVTDAAGNVVSETSKEIPLQMSAEGEQWGASEGSQDGLSGLISQYASNRYGMSKYANQESAMDMGSQTSGMSVQA